MAHASKIRPITEGGQARPLAHISVPRCRGGFIYIHARQGGGDRVGGHPPYPPSVTHRSGHSAEQVPSTGEAVSDEYVIDRLGHLGT